MGKLKLMIPLALLAVLVYACGKTEVLAPTKIKFETPSNFPSPIYKFEGNVLTNDGFALGKKLFYDARLSADQSISCGSCHQQFAAFANLDHQVSHGVNNCLGKRNAPVLFNLAWQKEFFWDGGAKNLEIVPLNAINDACEMSTDINSILTFLKRTPPYPQMFKAAFDSDQITSQNFLKALGQFTAAMVSAKSQYDKVMKQPNNFAFTADEQAGYSLFKANCASCHTEPLFTNLAYVDNGLGYDANDEGRKHITGLTTDAGKFRVPTLRNISLSAPYMHDGRFNNLNQVLEHYNAGVKQTPNLAPELIKNGSVGITLSALQKQQLISFLNTLTDDEFIKNKIFSEE